MNDTIFNSAKFKKGTVVWLLPIRFWEIKEPTKCILLHDLTDESKSVYVKSEYWEGCVYVDRQSIFFSKELAIKAIEIYTALYNCYDADTFKYIISVMEKSLGIK